MELIGRNYSERFLKRKKEQNNAHKERASKKGGGSVSDEDYLRVLESDNCFYCKNHVAFGKRTIDHKIPISRFGQHVIENLVMSCGDCNTKKGCFTDSEIIYFNKTNNYCLERLLILQKQRRTINKIVELQSILLKKLCR